MDAEASCLGETLLSPACSSDCNFMALSQRGLHGFFASWEVEELGKSGSVLCKVFVLLIKW